MTALSCWDSSYTDVQLLDIDPEALLIFLQSFSFFRMNNLYDLSSSLLTLLPSLVDCEGSSSGFFGSFFFGFSYFTFQP